jgi:hypothetical protein
LSLLAIILEIILYTTFQREMGLKSSKDLKSSFFGITTNKVDLKSPGALSKLKDSSMTIINSLLVNRETL